MRLAFILDPLDTLKTYKDSSYAMMLEAASRGHALFALEQGDIRLADGQVIAEVMPLSLTDDAQHWHLAARRETLRLADFDAVLMRKDPPFDQEYLYSTYLLELAEMQGARVFNRPRAIRDHNEKLAIGRYPQFTVPTLVTRQPDAIRAFIAREGDAILKPLDAMGGSSIFRVHPADANLSVILETMTLHGARTIMAQRFIPEIADGDKRILLVDGVPAPYCLARIPKSGETRGNLAAGATGVARPLTTRDRAIAEGVGPSLAAQGLTLVGLDVIGDWLTEINVTSPTCMREIGDQTGFSVAAMMIDALERQVTCGESSAGSSR